MLLSIFEWLTQYLAELLELVVQVFLKALNFDLSTYINVFPLFGQAYSVFQSIALGILVLVAGSGLLQFALNPVNENEWTDRPVAILFKSGMAAALIFFGGYILEIVVDLAKIPFDMFVANDAVENGALFTVDNFTTALVESGIEVALTGASTTLISLIMVGLITWNIFKLIIEIAERFMYVGVLFFTAPLFFPLMATSKTNQIFKRWVSSFISSCILMAVSVFFLKLILSGFSYNLTTGMQYILRLLLILAVCQIAQRADNFMNQLGLSTPLTGAGLVNDLLSLRLLGVGRGHGGAGAGNGGTSYSAILGSSFKQGIAGKTAAAGSKAFRSAANTFAATGSVSEAMKNGGRTVANAAKSAAVESPVGKAVNAYKNTSNTTPNASTGQKVKEAAKAFGVASTIGAVKGTMDPIREAKFAEKKAANAEAYAKASEKYTNPTGAGPDPEKAFHAVDTGKAVPDGVAKSHYEAYGLGMENNGGSAFMADVDNNGDLALTRDARAAGATLGDSDSNGNSMIYGSSNVVSDILASSYGAGVPVSGETAKALPDLDRASLNNAMHGTLMRTVNEGNAINSEQALFDPRHTLERDDSLGSAMINKAFEGSVPVAKYSNVAAFNLPDNGELHGGRAVCAQYEDIQGNPHSINILDDTAYSAYPASIQAEYSEIQGASGDRYWITQKDLPDARIKDHGHQIGDGGSAEAPRLESSDVIYAEGSVALPAPEKPEPVRVSDSGFEQQARRVASSNEDVAATSTNSTSAKQVSSTREVVETVETRVVKERSNNVDSSSGAGRPLSYDGSTTSGRTRGGSENADSSRPPKKNTGDAPPTKNRRK